jgi:hypothetical protein
MTYETSYKLLAVLQHYAPTGAEQERCAHFLAEMQLGGDTQQEIDAALAGALLDGLRHGNWPWAVPRAQQPDYEAECRRAQEMERHE